MMREEDYRRFVSTLAPDAGMKNRLLRKVVHYAPANKMKIVAWAAAAACVIAAAIALPLLLDTDMNGTVAAIKPTDSAQAVKPSETAAEIQVIYGSEDYSSIYDELIAARPEIDSGGDWIEAECLSVQTLDDLKRQLADSYSNKESVTITDESKGFIYSAANRAVSVSDKDGNVIFSAECGSDRSFLIKSEGEEEIGVYEYYRELFLQPGRLYALKTVNRVIRADWGGWEEASNYRRIPHASQEYTLLEVYDVFAPEKIRFIKEIAISGAYRGVSMKNDSIDVFTCYSGRPADEARPETYIPMCYTQNVMRVFGTEDIYRPEDSGRSGLGPYFTGVSVKTETLEPQSFIAINETCDVVYFGNSAVYTFHHDYSEYDEIVRAWFNYTEIVKIINNNGDLGFAAQGRVKGLLPDGRDGPVKCLFNEDNGLFTVVTRIAMGGFGHSKNESRGYYDNDGKPYPNYFAFYTLDSDLNIVGMVDKIGYISGEWLEFAAVRREGSIVYIVGSIGYQEEQVKKLFMIDLSDPANPVLLDNDTVDDIESTIEWVCETGE